MSTYRPIILGRSLVAGAAGLVPVPYIDDLLAGAVRSGLIRRIAELRQVDVDANAVANLATPRGSRLLQAASIGTAALGTSRRLFRRLAGSLLVVRRVDEAMQTFQVGTLFDYYCARHHVGLGLDGARAEKVRRAIDAATRQARGETLARSFRGVLRAPRFVLGAIWAKLRPRKGPIEPAIVDEK